MKPSTLTEVERLQLVNQYKILEKLDPTNENQYMKFRKILEDGITIFYEKIFEDILPEVRLQRCHFVKEVADTFLALQSSFSKLHEKSGLDERDVLFFGFDVRDEDEWRFMQFVKTTACEWEEEGIWRAILGILKAGPDSNQAVPREGYSKMLKRWNEIKPRYEDEKTWRLTKEEIRGIIAEDNVPE